MGGGSHSGRGRSQTRGGCAQPRGGWVTGSVGMGRRAPPFGPGSINGCGGECAPPRRNGRESPYGETPPGFLCTQAIHRQLFEGWDTAGNPETRLCPLCSALLYGGNVPVL